MQQAVKLYLVEARHSLAEKNYGKAYAFFLLTLKLNQHVEQEIAEDFGTAWKEWSRELYQLKRTNDLMELYEQGTEVFMRSDALHLHMGTCLFQMGLKLEAVGMFRRALIVNNNSHEASVNLENACRGLVDSWHFAMLNDHRRNKTFRDAIRDAVDAIDWDDCILDIGSGTGLLGMFAIQSGAAKVHCCEMSEAMHSIAEESIALNNMDSNIVNIHSDSLNLIVSGNSSKDVPAISEKAMLVIAEIVDAGLLGEGIVDSLNHAWQNLLLPQQDGGVVIPYSATVYCALAESDSIWKKHNFSTNPVEMQNILITSGVGQDVGKSKSNMAVDSQQMLHVFSTSVHEPYTSERMGNVTHRLLSGPCKLMDINFNSPGVLIKIANGQFDDVFVDFHNIKQGSVDCLVLWFQLYLDPDKKHCITTEIGSEVCWDQAIYPIRACKIAAPGHTETFTQLECQRLQVQPSDILRANFSVHVDRFQLESIDTLSFDAQCTKSYPQVLSKIAGAHPELIHVALHEAQVMKINDTATCDIWIDAVKKLSTSKRLLNILDISDGFSIFPFRMCQLLGPEVSITKICNTQELLNACKEIAKSCKLQSLTFALDTFFSIGSSIFDAVVLDIVEPSGLLAPDSLTNVANLRPLLNTSTCFVPYEVSVQMQCIQSEELLSKCIVTSDSSTLDLKISECINPYRVSVHSDLNLSTLAYQALSETSQGLTFDFRKIHDPNYSFNNLKKSLVSKITSAGTIHGILFWFKIAISDECTIETNDEHNFWQQAAYVFPQDKQISVACGDEIVLTNSCLNESLLFSLSKYEPM